MFDRRHIILPVVPLGCVAKTSFMILNDGYENLNVKMRIDRQMDPNELPLKINLESDQLGVTK